MFDAIFKNQAQWHEQMLALPQLLGDALKEKSGALAEAFTQKVKNERECCVSNDYGMRMS
jgi:hypothetical protein